MKSKKLATFLSIVSGSSGSQRFYTAQNKRGLLLLSLCWVIFPGLAYTVKTLHLLSYWQWVVFGWVVTLLIVHIAEAMHFSKMQDEKFRTQVSTSGSTGLGVFLSIFIALCLGFGAAYFLQHEKEIDIDHAKAAYTMTSLEYSEKFEKDEKTFITTYENRVMQVQGQVISTGFDLETNANFILLQSIPGASTDLHCYFNAKHQAELNTIAKHDMVTVLGVCDGRFLNNCRIVEHQSAPPESEHTGPQGLQSDTLIEKGK